ncbi:MAG TPA: hypothetical protein VKI44_17945 [Acetobacteraceae bacterium]|nr:hypothetical protein [Acetobacteraceae bacterium]
MIRQKLYRPSLKITRQTDQGRAGGITFEVWSPFTGNYQVVASIEAGMRRVNQLAGLICQMRLHRHPKQGALADVPDTDGADTAEWAEFRINATTYRTYDTRRHDRPGWARATSLIQATETTCAKIGYELPR